MNKKTHLFLFLMLLAAMLITGKRAFTWEATIHAEGDDSDNVSEYQVDIGIATVADKLASDTPTDYTVKMDLIDINDNAWLSKDIREFGEAEYMWKLRVDTDGTTPTSIVPYIWWQDNELGSGKFEMRSGNDGTGPVVVADMKTTTSQTVPDNAVTEFTIHKAPEDCGGTYSLPQDTWQLIALPCEPVADTVADLFGDDFTGAYNDTWVLYERDENLDLYNILNSGSSLSQGQGYWIYTDESGVSLDMTGTATPLSTTDCSSPGCFEMLLTLPPAFPPNTRLFNMQGHPLPYEVKWADVRIMVDGDSASLFTPSAADADGYLSKIVNKWNGNAYDAYDDVTPGMIGVLGPYEGFWVEILENPLGARDISLLIPAGINSIASLNLNNNNELQIAAANDAWLGRWYNWLLPQANAASPKSNKKEVPGLAKRDAHKKTHEKSIKDNEEWYIRLIVEAPKEGLLDKNNVFGQLSDSKKGYDEHDLKELPPFGEKYLTIVFPHPEWDDKANDYASDFHPLNSRKGKDQWSFEVRTNDTARELTLSWSGPEDILNHSQLIDKETLEIIEIKPGKSYTFVINDISRSFVWKYSAKSKKSKKGNRSRVKK